MSSHVRVRFAPSPTGKIHLGGLRMALYNYIFAKQNNGSFVLRIEDTDKARCVPGAASEIENVLDWVKLTPNESPLKGGPYQPYVQSDRLNLYKEKAFELVEKNKAYKCFCSSDRLELLRRYQTRNRVSPGYDGKCRHLSSQEVKEKALETKGKFVVRLKVKTDTIILKDMIFGDIKENTPKNDLILLKSDSYPTYHLANVVDDHQMKITHVLRGSEWLTSLSKHLQIYDAFGWIPPTFAHFPLITTHGGAKMSKRKQDSTVEYFKEQGYDRLALLNFLTNIGGGLPKQKQDSNEVWSLNDIVSNFDFNNVSRHPGSADLNRLNIFSQNELRKTYKEDPNQITERLKRLFTKNDISCQLTDQEIKKILNIFICRIEKLADLFNYENSFIWAPPKLTWFPEEYKQLNVSNILEAVITLLENCDEFNKSNLDQCLRSFSEQNKVDWPILMRMLRKVLTNNERGLPVYEIMCHLQKEKTVQYLRNAMKYIRTA